MKIVILPYYILSVTYIWTRRKNLFSPTVLFVICQFFMFTGILTFVDFSIAADKKLVCIYLLVLLMFCVGSLFAKRNIVINEQVSDQIFEMSSYQNNAIIFMVLVSIALCAYLFVQNGGNAFIYAIRSIILGSDGNIIQMRYGFTQVKGIGYIAQFRGVILPVLNIILLVNRKNRELCKLGVIILPFTIVFLLGTGQRGQFVLILLVLIVDIFLQKKYLNYNVKFSHICIVVGIAFVMFSVLSFSNGRVSDSSTSVVEGAIQSFTKRIFDDNQECAVVGFRYIDSLPVTWGGDWLHMLADLLPGKNDYLSIDYRIFKIVYGSTNGTAPPCIWGSAYHNFGYLGVPIFSFVLGYIYERVYISFLRKQKNQINIGIYAGIFVLMGSWMAGSPVYLFNTGVVSLIIMKMILLNIRFNNGSVYIVSSKEI